MSHILIFRNSLETRSVTEPSGALALAGLKRYIQENNLVGAQKRFVAVVSGANMNFDRLRFVAERAELGEGREALISVDIPERTGRCVCNFSRRSRLIRPLSFLLLHSIIHPRAVTEFIYRYNCYVPSDRAHIIFSLKLETPDRDNELKQLFAEFEKQDIKASDISDNEFAKSHARYMIGGSQIVPDERVLRFGMLSTRSGCSRLSVRQNSPNAQML